MGLFDRRTDRLELAIRAFPTEVRPGDEVAVEVEVTGAPDPQLVATEVELRARGTQNNDTPVGAFGRVETQHTWTHHLESVPGPTTPGTYRYAFRLPPDAVPTAAAAFTQAAEWTISVHGRGARAHRAWVTLQVRRPAPAASRRSEIPVRAVHSSDAVALAVSVPRALRSGVTVPGVVRVHATRDVQLQGIALALRSWVVRHPSDEPDPRGDAGVPFDDPAFGAARRPVEDFEKPIAVPVRELAAGEFVDVPFEFRVPTDDFPTCNAPLLRTHWVLGLTAAVRGADDAEIELELDVHNG